MLPMLSPQDQCSLSITTLGELFGIYQIEISKRTCLLFLHCMCIHVCDIHTHKHPLDISFNRNELSVTRIFCRTNPFEFIIPLQNYLKSTVPDYSIGTRVQMQCDVEESLRR